MSALLKTNRAPWAVERINRWKTITSSFLLCDFFALFALSCQLTVGLYEFKVTVDGEGAQGEGYVNVTVKPGEVEQIQNAFKKLLQNIDTLTHTYREWTK